VRKLGCDIVGTRRSDGKKSVRLYTYANCVPNVTVASCSAVGTWYRSVLTHSSHYIICLIDKAVSGFARKINGRVFGKIPVA